MLADLHLICRLYVSLRILLMWLVDCFDLARCRPWWQFSSRAVSSVLCLFREDHEHGEAQARQRKETPRHAATPLHQRLEHEVRRARAGSGHG